MPCTEKSLIKASPTAAFGEEEEGEAAPCLT